MSAAVLGNQPSTDLLGLIAGDGEVPRLIAVEAQRQGCRVVAVTLSKAAAQALAPYSDDVIPCGVGQAKKIIETLHGHRVRQIVLAGKVQKRLLFENPRFDIRALQMLRKAKNRDDASLLTLIIDELEVEGFDVRSQTDFLNPFLAPLGCLTRRKPNRREQRDIAYGFEVARRMADLEIGQTVVIKGQSVVAVEAVEGTDEAIRRGGSIAKQGAVVVKVSRGNQDFRYDVPAVGFQTMQRLIEAKARVLALEAQRTLILQRDEMLEAANQAGVSVVAVA